MFDLQSQLDEYLSSVVERIDVDEIIEGPVARLSLAELGPKPTPRRKGWLYAAAAAAVTLGIVGLGAYLANRPLDREGFSTSGWVELHGLPPEDATPSTPLRGELVVNMWSHVDSDDWFSLYLYEDGRLIWLDGPHPETTTGWVQQRLSPEGVALVHDEIVATGLFDPERPGEPKQLPALGYIQVRTDSGLTVRWNGTIVDHPIRDRLRELQSWLPATAWAEPEPIMYVPASYGVCLEYRATIVPADPAQQLSALPPTAQQMLAAARYYRPGDIGETDPAIAATWYSPHCYELTTEQARTLVDTFDAANLTRNESDSRLHYEATDPESRTVHAIIVPFMPHGAPAS